MEIKSCGSIRFNEEFIQELDGNQVIVSIPKKEIISLQLFYGESVEKPILQLFAGIIMCLIGLVIGVWPSLGIIFKHETVGTPIVLKTFAFAAPLIIIGVAVIIPIFRKCHYILVKTSNYQRKIAIKDYNPAEIVSSAQILGYQILDKRELKP